MIRVSTNFDLKSNIPLDNRLSFETENDMLGIEPLDIYYGAITHVKKSNKTYMYVATEFDVHSNPTKGKWVQIFENAKPIVTAESVKYETGKESDGTPIYGKNIQQVLDSLQNDFKNSIAGNKWKEPVNNENDLTSLNPAPVQGEVRYVIGKGIYMFNGANWISVVDTIPLANTTKSGLMSANDKVKVEKINISSTASNKYFGEDGNYHDVTSLDVVTTSANGIMSSADKAKLDGISIDKASGSTSKFLNEQGQFVTISGTGSSTVYPNATQTSDGLMSASDKVKLDAYPSVSPTGDASKVLNEKGQFVTITGSGLTKDQTDKINKIQISTDPNADSLYLGKDGNYHDVTSLDVVTTSANGIMSSTDKTKLDALPSLPLASATGSKFLNDLGQFTTVSAILNASDQAKLDKIITSGDGSLVLSNNGNYVALPTLVTQIKDGLMSANDKKKLDSYGSLPAGATGSKFLNDLGQFTAVTATLNASDQAKLDKIITTGDGSLVLSNNGNYVALPGLVTQVKDGLMSSTDKTKLDGILIDKASGSTVKFLNEQGNFTDFVVDAKNVNYNPPAGSRLTATTVQGAFDEVLDKVSNIDDSAATTSTTSTYSISKINDLLRSKSNTGHNHSVTDITDLTANYYTQAQVDSKIKNAANAMIWQPPVNEIADLATTYPNPENGWTVIVQNENSFYRYNGTTWVNFGTMQFNSLVTSSENGLMSSADKIKLDKIDENAPRIYYSSTEPPRVNGNIWVVD